MPDTDLYTIVDLSRVWIMADLFEYEAPNIHVGEMARITLQAIPGGIFTARINHILAIRSDDTNADGSSRYG
jgi:Cu(I)/Ag(I) efflux system membrane fusion protein